MILDLSVLTTPLPKETLFVYLAASKEAVSAVLLVVRKGKQHPIHYVSRTMHDAERNYALLEKMALVLRHVSRRLRRYFEAHPITVITDQPIKQILNKADTSDFINEVPVGSEATVSWQSKYTIDRQKDCKEEWIPYTDGASSIKGFGAGLWWKKRGSIDDPIINCLERGVWPQDQNEARALRMKIGQYVMEEGILFKKSYLMSMLRCVGLLQANYVIREIHMGACNMHLNASSVVAKANRQGYYWPTMHRDAREEIHKCDSCQIHYSIPKLPKTLMTSIMAPWPFFRRGMDVLGPLPEAPGKVKFVIVAVDYFTKWIEAKPLAKTTGKEIKKFV
nr:reverse transcriptase domain-containing protein [Tanacetum cinerariifolium]